MGDTVAPIEGSPGMASYDDDFDYENEHDDEDGDDSVESRVWQLLTLINPGDEKPSERTLTREE